jgi:hypothetical protein
MDADRPEFGLRIGILRIEDGRLTEQWNMVQDEATAAESKSGLPMISDRFSVF